MNDLIFALDIGTRSVVGVVCENNGNMLKINAIESCFHSQRSMIDGQIEDIEEVSRIVGLVKNNIEAKLDIKLSKVCIAAAGRALKTERVLLKKDSDLRVPVTREFIKSMETEALQLAQDVFSNTGKNDLFYCVGYSVLTYALDGRSMSKIEGHRGSEVSVEIIAAFLPHTVIEGLYSCMDNNGLEVCNLTLEPIAAMDLIIPKDLRLLNLALVDIGAGTSDIAISKNGSIVGYDMATVAGDEITECLMRCFLIDFDAAEDVKMAVSSGNDPVQMTNILGISQDVPLQDILEAIRPTVYDLCADISSKILNMNNEAPAAVFLAGGGSKTPYMKEFLSELLNIPQSRIALTDKRSLKNVDLSLTEYYGPELITPFGIAYSVVLNKNYDFFSVTVNHKKIRLYGIREMKVLDAILMSGFDTKKLIGISGKSLRFTVNGTQHYYAGEFSTPSKITVNSKTATIEDIIRPGDIIEILPAKNGNSPTVRISDIADTDNRGFVYFNGMRTSLKPRCFANNNQVNEDYIICGSDSIEIIHMRKVSDLYRLYKTDEKLHKLFINGVESHVDSELYDGFIIDVMNSAEAETDNPATVMVEDKPIEDISNANISEAEIEYMRVYINGNSVELPKREENYIFADMLNYTDIDPSKPGGDIILLHNGKEASYLNLISEDDEITIKWG